MQLHPFITRPTCEPAPWARTSWPFKLDVATPTARANLIDESTLCAENDQPLTKRVHEWGVDLLGRAAPAGRIPYAARWLGTSKNTPIYVTQSTAEPAHKAWYIFDAEEGATIHRGLKPGASVDDFVNACANDPDSARAMLNAHAVKRGQCYYIAPGVPHAAGPGVVLAEIQSATAQTIELTNATASIETLLERSGTRAPDKNATTTAAGAAPFEKKSHVTSLFTTVTRLITTPTFYVERVRFMGELEQDIPYAELVCWLVLEGTGAVLYGKNESLAFEPGNCVILPANLRDAKLRTDTDCVWLEITVPAESDLAAYPRPDASYLQSNEGTAQHPIPLNISIEKKK